MEITLEPIGYVKSSHRDVAKSGGFREQVALIVIDMAYAKGLAGLADQERLLVTWYAHEAKEVKMRARPRSDPTTPETGVFNSRSPHRPNHICTTAVEILDLKGNVIKVKGLDAIDGTPVLDIKPYDGDERAR